jgi:hypothetical protein
VSLIRSVLALRAALPLWLALPHIFRADHSPSWQSCCVPFRQFLWTSLAVDCVLECLLYHWVYLVDGPPDPPPIYWAFYAVFIVIHEFVSLSVRVRELPPGIGFGFHHISFMDRHRGATNQDFSTTRLLYKLRLQLNLPSTVWHA